MSDSRRRTGARLPFLARFKSVQGWIALFSILGVVTIALVDVDRASPGPLATAHGSVEELENGASCASCHGGLFSGMTESCLECHAVIAAHLEESEGLHGSFDEGEAARCALCHSEHHGEAFALINKQSFVRAGIDDPEAFDHSLIGFAMTGRHLELACAECHVNAEASVLPAGEHRFVGLDPSCVRCHDDPHAGRMVRDCADCHTQDSFDALHAVGHAASLALIGGHRGQDCRTCHAEGSERSLENLARGLRGRAQRQCADCHASPHAEKFSAGVARVVRDAPGASCVACHVEEHRSFLGDGNPEPIGLGDPTVGALALPRLLAELMTPRLHAASDFPLTAPHKGVDCAACHASDEPDYSARFPGRDADTCSVCHADPHGGQFEDGLFEGQQCTACHDRERFEPHEFDLEAHARTPFPLEGAHGETDCAACHVDPARGRARRFHGTPGRCEACHEDGHGGFFDEALATLPSPRAEGSCAECHLSTTFDDVQSASAEVEPLAPEEGPAEGPAEGGFAGRPFDHTAWTEFAIRGAHSHGTCEDCHPRAATADALGRRFGRVEEHFGDYEGCATCHQDPHEGRFDTRALPERHKGQTGCQRCHIESSFRALPHAFDHELWTDFELDGAHKTASCGACHAPLRKPDAVGRTWGRAAGASCGACHDDPHAAQFEVAGVTDCARCHRSAEGFDVLRFDHERHSRFPLGESHAQVACSSCHLGWKLQLGVEIVRYRPLETSCASCHGSQEGPALRRRGRRD